MTSLGKLTIWTARHRRLAYVLARFGLLVRIAILMEQKP